MTARSLEGRCALVTGASGGIGAAIALALAEAGARVAVHGRDAARTQQVAKAIEAAGDHAHIVLGELSTDAAAAEVADQAEAALGGVDILVNNAGGESAGSGLAGWFEAAPADWMQTYASNVGSMVRLTHRFSPAMRAKGWGRLIQLSSGVVEAPMTSIPDYQAAKLAIRSLTRTLSKTLALTGVTANSISPGLILTANVETWIRALAVEAGWDGGWAEWQVRAAREMFPNHSGRLGRPEDIARAALFLADPAADFVNGVDIRVDGGV